MHHYVKNPEAIYGDAASLGHQTSHYQLCETGAQRAKSRNPTALMPHLKAQLVRPKAYSILQKHRTRITVLRLIDNIITSRIFIAVEMMLKVAIKRI